MGEKIVIIGGIAAGTSAAAKIRRKSEEAEVIIYEKDKYISYGTCGLPYFVSGKIKNLNKLLINTPKGFKKRFNVEVRCQCEVKKIDAEKKVLEIEDLKNGKVFKDRYQKLIITTGSMPVRLKFGGQESENIFVLKTLKDAIRLKKFLKAETGGHAVIIGGGFIGLELIEAFKRRNMPVTIIEKTGQLLPMFDRPIIKFLENYLETKGINILKNDEVTNLNVRNGLVKSVKTKSGRKIDSSLVFFGIGTKPNTKLAKDCGINTGKNGSIEVDEFMKTNIRDIFAAGDCCECLNNITGHKSSFNLASIANRQGRVAGYNAAGGREKFGGSIVTSIIRVLDIAVGKTGISLQEARSAGINAQNIELHYGSHAGYYPGAEMLHMLVVYEKENGKILGGQAIGREAVDKKIDILSTAIKNNLKVWELANLDLCYQPAYGSAKDSINILGMIAENLKKGEMELIDIDEFKEIRENKGITLLDVRTKREFLNGSIEGAINIDINELRENIDKLDKNKRIVVFCKTGYRAYLAYRILKNKEFEKVEILNGSIISWRRRL
ncbi:MAG: FAD-dependent oxidoreductase [Actinomycetota bacterium]